LSKQGGNTSSVEYSPQALKRRQRGRLRQEERWAARSGPVTTSAIVPGCGHHCGVKDEAEAHCPCRECHDMEAR